MKYKLARFITVFFSGFLLMLSINIFNDWSYEREMLSNLRDHVYSRCKNRNIATVVDTALYYSHMLQHPASEIYSDKKFYSLKKYFVPSSFQNFYFGREACGAYASFFVRLMSSAGYRAQITQLNIRNRKNAHMVVSIFVGNKIYIVDPLFKHDFRDANGNLSDIRDVSDNWYTYYSKHLPENYEQLYNYQYGWSYTNWDKYGAFSRGIYKAACLVFGKEKTDLFSIRYYTQGYNKIYLILALSAFFFFFLHALRLSFAHTVSQYISFQWNKWKTSRRPPAEI